MSNCKCSCSSGVKTVLACSGASNVGQISNEAAKRLDIGKEARFFCLAGVGGHVSGMIASVEGSDRVLVIDGCPVACAKLAMEHAGISEYDYVVVTDYGIEKNHEFDLAESDIERVTDACRAKLNGCDLVEGAISEDKLAASSLD